MFRANQAIASIRKTQPISSYLRAAILQFEFEALIIHLLDKEETPVINILKEGGPQHTNIPAIHLLDNNYWNANSMVLHLNRDYSKQFVPGRY